MSRFLVRIRRGFSLVELLGVIVIIGILAAIALARYKDFKERAYVDAMKNDLHNYALAQVQWDQTHNTYAASPTIARTEGYAMTVDVSVDTVYGGPTKWWMVVKHAKTPIECSLGYGDVPADWRVIECTPRTLPDTDATQVATGPQRPLARLTAEPVPSKISQAVIFSSLGSSVDSTQTATYLWDFGDGQASTGLGTLHAYTDTGQYHVSLVVSDQLGQADTAQTILRVSADSAGDARLSCTPATLDIGQNTTCTGVPPVGAASYAWSTDGTPSDANWQWFSSPAAQPWHYYWSTYGTHHVILSSYDGSYTKLRTDTVLVSIIPRPVTLACSDTVDLGEVATCNVVRGGVVPGSVVHAMLEWPSTPGGNGPIWQQSAWNADTAQNAFAYYSWGPHTVKVQSSDWGWQNQGPSATTIINVRVRPISLSCSPLSATPGQQVNCTASIVGMPGGVPTTYANSPMSYWWTTSGGAPTSAVHPAWNYTGATQGYTWNQVGSYWIKARSSATYDNSTFSQNNGPRDSALVRVDPPIGPPNALFTISPTTTPLAGDTLSFDASKSTSSQDGIASYSWDFGDGTTGSGVVATHSFTSGSPTGASYPVQLTVTSGTGLTGSATQTLGVYVPVQRPTAAFTVSPNPTNTGGWTGFDGRTSTSPNGSILAYAWDFGDPLATSGSGSTPYNWYKYGGTYTATLTIYDNLYNAASVSHDVVVTGTANQPPIARATATPASAQMGDLITFDGSTSSDPDGTITNYTWRIPSYNYSATGVQTAWRTRSTDGSAVAAWLIVTDNGGLKDSVLTTVPIRAYNGPPYAAFTSSPSQYYQNGTRVNFDASQSSDPDDGIATYFWDFGDGSTTVATTPFYAHTYAADGVYTVTLVVTDHVGQTATATRQTGAISCAPGSISPAPGGASVGYESSGAWYLSFNATGGRMQIGYPVAGQWWYGRGANPQNNGNNYVPGQTYAYAAMGIKNGTASWWFGDGSPRVDGLYAQHTYTQSGDYTVKMVGTYFEAVNGPERDYPVCQLFRASDLSASGGAQGVIEEAP